jgi:hypothetical protein
MEAAPMDYAIVSADEIPENKAETDPAPEAPLPLALEQPDGMDWILNVVSPVDFMKSSMHGRYAIGFHPPVRSIIHSMLGIYGGHAALAMVNCGLVPAIVVNDPLLATLLDQPLDLVTTTCTLLSSYLAVIAYYAALCSSPSDEEVQYYEKTQTFPEEASATVREMNSFLSYGYLNGTEFSGTEHMHLPTPKNLTPGMFGRVAAEAARAEKRADGVLPSTVVTQFLLTKLMAHARSGGNEAADWFTERKLKSMPTSEMEIDAEERLPCHAAIVDGAPVSIQGAVRVVGSYRRSPEWFRAFFTRRKWFYPTCLPAWFSDTWLMRVVGRIVLYEHNAKNAAFMNACAHEGEHVLRVAAALERSGEDTPAELVQNVAIAFQGAYERTLHYVHMMRGTLVELLSIVRAPNDRIDAYKCAFVPKIIKDEGGDIPCVVGEAACNVADGERVYEDDGALHIPQNVYDMCVAEVEHNTKAAFDMALRLSAFTDLPPERVKRLAETLEHAVGSVPQEATPYGAPAKDVLVGMICVGVQKMFALKRISLFEGGKTEPAMNQTVHEMFVVETDAMRGVTDSGRQMMLGHHASAFPALSAGPSEE